MQRGDAGHNGVGVASCDARMGTYYAQLGTAGQVAQRVTFDPIRWRFAAQSLVAPVMRVAGFAGRLMRLHDA